MVAVGASIRRNEMERHIIKSHMYILARAAIPRGVTATQKYIRIVHRHEANFIRIGRVKFIRTHSTTISEFQAVIGLTNVN